MKLFAMQCLCFRQIRVSRIWCNDSFLNIVYLVIDRGLHHEGHHRFTININNTVNINAPNQAKEDSDNDDDYTENHNDDDNDTTTLTNSDMGSQFLTDNESNNEKSTDSDQSDTYSTPSVIDDDANNKENKQS